MRRTRLRTLTTVAVAAAGLLAPVLLSGAGPAAAGGATYGKVVFVDDGDTVDVDVAGDGTGRPNRIRYIGVQAMELRVYSHTLTKLRGECWGVQATRNQHSILNKRRVQLSSRRDSSHAGNRLRRSVSVQQGGAWVDTGGLQIDAGLALPDLIPDEYRMNLDYMVRAQRAAAAGIGMWGNPAQCGVGPAQDAQLGIHINWDAAHNDGANVNGEWVDITNNGTSAVNLGGWWIRDAAYRGTKAHGYAFPSGSVVEPGSTLRLRVGRGQNRAGTQFWGQRAPIFANVTRAPRWMGDGAWLFDPQGDLRFWNMYPCRYAC